RLLRERRGTKAGNGSLDALSHARTAGAAPVPAGLHFAVTGPGSSQCTGGSRYRPQWTALPHALSRRAGGRTLPSGRLGPAESIRPLPRRHYTRSRIGTYV